MSLYSCLKPPGHEGNCKSALGVEWNSKSSFRNFKEVTFSIEAPRPFIMGVGLGLTNVKIDLTKKTMIAGQTLYQGQLVRLETGPDGISRIVGFD